VANRVVDPFDFVQPSPWLRRGRQGKTFHDVDLTSAAAHPVRPDTAARAQRRQAFKPIVRVRANKPSPRAGSGVGPPRGALCVMNAIGLFRLNHCDAIDALAFGLDLNPCPRMNDTGVDCPTFGIDVADLFR
jgi:hypothetical protein